MWLSDPELYPAAEGEHHFFLPSNRNLFNQMPPIINAEFCDRLWQALYKPYSVSHLLLLIVHKAHAQRRRSACASRILLSRRIR